MSLRGPAGITEGTVDGADPSAVTFTFGGCASAAPRTGMAEESGIVLIRCLEGLMHHTAVRLNCKKKGTKWRVVDLQ